MVKLFLKERYSAGGCGTIVRYSQTELSCRAVLTRMERCHSEIFLNPMASFADVELSVSDKEKKSLRRDGERYIRL